MARRRVGRMEHRGLSNIGLQRNQIQPALVSGGPWVRVIIGAVEIVARLVLFFVSGISLVVSNIIHFIFLYTIINTLAVTTSTTSTSTTTTTTSTPITTSTISSKNSVYLRVLNDAIVTVSHITFFFLKFIVCFTPTDQLTVKFIRQ